MDGMPINDKYTPTAVPVNQFTQMIDLVHARNAGMVPPVMMPSMQVGVPVSGTPLPTARSADLGRPVDLPPVDRPLSVEEIEELNRAAIASGLVQGPVNPGIANTLGNGEDDSPYASLEDAIRAGASVNMDESAIEEAALRHRDPMPNAPAVHVRPPVGGQVVPPGSVRPVRPQVAATSLPKLPDFKKVQMIDLVNGTVYVDGLSFDVTSDELKMLRKFAVKKVREQIQAMLDAALAEDVDGIVEGTV